jgi:hypothetical protein
MMRQRGYTVLPTSSKTVQDEYTSQEQQQQQQQQFRSRSQQHSSPQLEIHQQQHDDADVAAGSRIQQQQEQQEQQMQQQQQLRKPLIKASSTSKSLSPSHRLHSHKNYCDSNDTTTTTTTTATAVGIIPNVESYATLDSSSFTIETAPSSACTINSVKCNTGDLEFFEDLITEPVLVLGMDISHLPKATQFTVCASGLFFFSLLYGYLQELLSVTLCSRQLGLFLATTQFTGYTVLAYIMRNFVYKQQQHFKQKIIDQHAIQYGIDHSGGQERSSKMFDAKHVPLALYLGLSILRAIDLAMVRPQIHFALFTNNALFIDST